MLRMAYAFQLKGRWTSRYKQKGVTKVVTAGLVCSLLIAVASVARQDIMCTHVRSM